MNINENIRWLLSFYRTSEISGALFFGQLARSMKPGIIQHNMTQQFADEAQHSVYWADCLNQLDMQPYKLARSYQDYYLKAAGLPSNLMEVLAITHVFELRVFEQYSHHKKIIAQPKIVLQTLDTIIGEEVWHLKWVRKALKNMEVEYGVNEVQSTIKRFMEADKAAYLKVTDEYQDRIETIMLTA